MKKIVYLIMAFTMVFTTSCDPMEDVYEEIGDSENVIIGDAFYTVTDDDYDDLGLTYGSFNSIDEVKTMLPPILSAEYPVWGKGSSALAEFNLYIGSAFSIENYTLTEEDYASTGSDLLGFESDQVPSEYLPGILANNISGADAGDYVIAKYSQYTGDAYTVTPTVSLEENFDYGDTAGDLTTITMDWTTHSGSTAVGYVATSLSMTDYPTSDMGGSITIVPTNSEDVNRVFTTISEGKVYASALVNLSDVGSGNYFFHVMEAPDTQPYAQFRSRVGAKSNGSGKVLFGIGASSSSLTYGTTAYDLNTTYLLVSSYEISTGTSNLYVLSSAEDMEPETPEATNTGSAGNAISAVAFRQSSNIPSATVDGVRLANSWSAIMSNDDLEDEVIGDKEAGEASYTFSEGVWEPTGDNFYELTTEDYDSMGTASGLPGRYNNFDSNSPPEDYVPNLLRVKFPYALEGAAYDVAYNYYSSGLQLRGNRYTFTDGVWMPYTSVIVSTLQFGNDGTNWVPDNTIKYTLTSDDVSLMANALSSKYPGPTANVLQYGSFDRRPSSSNYWSDEMLVEGFNIVLDSLNPSAEEGQKYVITFVVYTGAVGNESMNLIKSNGEYIINE